MVEELRDMAGCRTGIPLHFVVRSAGGGVGSGVDGVVLLLLLLLL